MEAAFSTPRQAEAVAEADTRVRNPRGQMEAKRTQEKAQLGEMMQRNPDSKVHTLALI